MNVTRLFVGSDKRGELVHQRSASFRVTRTQPELSANVARLGQALMDFGIRTGDRVLILGGSRVEIVESILAAFNIGATAIPLNPLLGPINVLSVIARLRPKCCIFEDLPELPVRNALDASGAVMIPLKAPAPDTFAGHIYRDLVAGGTTALGFPEHDEDHPALVLHGSGSSGALKAVTLSHGELLRFFEYHNFIYSQYSDGPDTLTATSPILTGLPVTHLAGFALCLQGLMGDRRTFLLSFFLPRAYLQIVEEIRCHHILLVPSLYRALLKEPFLQEMDRSALRFCIAGGEPCPEELAEAVEKTFGVPLLTTYSMTECLSGIGHLRHDLYNRRVKRGSCGRQLFGELSLRDELGREQPDEGELWVRNATVHRCYLDDALNEERMTAGWFRTGDLFHRNADGDFYHRGRVDDMFIYNGKNIYPIEMELLLMKHPAVEAVCAAPVNLPDKGPIPAALIVLRDTVTKAEIQAFSMKNGPSHAVPQIVLFTDHIPLVGPGKIDRRWVMHALQRSCVEGST